MIATVLGRFISRKAILLSVLVTVAVSSAIIYLSYSSIIGLITDHDKNTSLTIAALIRDEIFQATPLTSTVQDEKTLLALRRIVARLRLHKLKVYSDTGVVIYSTDTGEIGRRNERDYFREIVMQGGTYQKIVTKQSTAGGVSVPVEVMETYVPIMDGTTFQGAFEIYADLTGTIRLLHTFLERMTLYFLLLGSILAALVIFINRRAMAVEQELQLSNLRLARHKADLELRHARGFLEKVMDSSRSAIFVLGPDGRFRLLNRAAEELTGYRPEELAGERYRGLVPSEALPEADEMFRRATLGQPVTDCELPIAHKDGTVRTVLLSGSPMAEEDGTTSIVGTAIDITERKRLELETRQAKEEAEAASRAKSDFLANMSHEIRTPMHGVLGLTELLLTEPLSARAREYLLLVKKSGRALLEIINDILDFSKIEARKIEIEEQPFSLRELLDSTLGPLRVAADAKGLEVVRTVPDDVPDHLVGDQGRLRQVLTNIVGNAIKYTPRGRVRIGVATVEDGAPEAGSVRLLFRVEDSGIGIPEDKLEDIFVSFSQVGTSAHVKYGGTGLGLSISKSLVELMGGRIWAASGPSGGSTFLFTLPLRIGAGRPPAREARPDPSRPVRKLRILLAEDDRINRLMAVDSLKSRGHDVDVAVNGFEAIDKLRAGRFDLVLMDVRMPGLDGQAATQAIRAGEAGPDKAGVPIIALTAHALEGDRERFLAAGMDAYLAKPFTPDELEEALERVLG